ncbi:hypothetical protein CRUP_014835 [Coryphaenoides rupestris]|nr:hypothetical protein CRUP_014835 [Coryphaenoides rupestris]
MPGRKMAPWMSSPTMTVTMYIPSCLATTSRKMAPWMSSPTMTVTMYIPSCLATTSRSSMEMILPQIRQAIPKGEYLDGEHINSC